MTKLTNEQREAGCTDGEPTYGWRGETVYRKCLCGETAHDAKYMPSSQAFAYLCRNCRSPWIFERTVRQRVEGAKATLKNTEISAASAAKWIAEWRTRAHECNFEPDVLDPGCEICLGCRSTQKVGGQ